MSDPSSRRERLLWGAFLAAVCIAAYANGLTGTFTYDDKAIVRDNPRIRLPSRVPEIFSTSYFGSPRGSGTAYRPVLLLSYAVQWWIHGKNAFAFHSVNLLLHIAATLLLGSLLLRAGVSEAVSRLAALFFAVLPVHVEAVTSLVGRGETLAAVFVLGYLLLALEPRSGLRRVLRFAAALLLYALGILTKESAAVAPGLLFLLLAYRAPEGGGPVSRFVAALRKGAIFYAASAAVLLGTLFLRSWVLGGFLRAPGWSVFEVENPLEPLSTARRIANASAILLRYAGRTLFPLHLSADESAWSIRMLSPLSFVAIAAVVLLAAAAILAILRLPSRAPAGAAALGVLFFGVAFLPAANLLYPIGTIFGERTAYLPSVGLCLVLASACAGTASSPRELSRRARGAAAAVAILFAGRTAMRNAVWWSDFSLFSNSIRTAPASAKTHYNWAYVCAESGRTVEALTHYTQAVRIYDGYWDAWAGKGRMERELGRLTAAEASYRRALAANASYENGFFGLGLVHEEQERLSDAEAVYRKGLAKNPDSLPLAFRLASVLTEEESPEAGAAWRRALALGRQSAVTHADYAEWLLDQEREPEAVREAHAALRIDPGSPTALRVLARRAGGAGPSLGEALALEKACRSSGDRDDLEALARIAEASPAYRARFERVRGVLESTVEKEEEAERRREELRKGASS